MTAAEILQPAHVLTALAAKTLPEAVDEILASMRGDTRVADWDALRAAVCAHEAPAIDAGECSICIAHGRTNAATALAMGAGISPEGCGDGAKKIRLVFVAAIPAAFNNEYLRAVGSIARLCSQEGFLQKLLASKTPSDFIALLEAGGAKL